MRKIIKSLFNLLDCLPPFSTTISAINVKITLCNRLYRIGLITIPSSYCKMHLTADYDISPIPHPSYNALDELRTNKQAYCHMGLIRLAVSIILLLIEAVSRAICVFIGMYTCKSLCFGIL